MNHVQFRPRTSDDDKRLIDGVSPRVVKRENVIVVPEISPNPLIAWSRETTTQNSLHENEIDVYLVNCTEWPSRTKALCHHCCHAFNSVPVPLPMTFDSVRNVYHCRGNFCSWQCAKAYNMTVTPQRGQGSRNMYLSLLAYRLWVKYKVGDLKQILNFARFRIDPALPKEVLDVFGGNMTIEEFRKDFFGIIPPEEAIVGKPLLTIRQKLHLPFTTLKAVDRSVSTGIVSTRQPGTRRIESSSVHEHSNAFCERLNNATGGTTIKRKRQEDTKPTLLNTMGVRVVVKKK